MKLQIPRLLEDLLRAEHFEGAAEVLLRPMLDVAEDALARSPFSAAGRLLRGTVHLRPEGGYRGLVVLEPGAAACESAEGETMLPSLSVWRLVESRRVHVAVDVNLAEVTAGGGAPEPLDRLARDDDPSASRARLLGREATHLLCLPLRASRDEVTGMISIEVSCRPAMGHPFIWPECAADLQLLADLGSPYLRARPPRPTPRSPRTDDPGLPVVGAAMEAVVRLLRTFAPQEETILLSGLTGTGKSRLARWCHEHSARRGGPFEAADLNAVPPSMQLAELFGWRRGAFTGATTDHPGWVAQADGGTLFLDEIDKLSLEAQAGLLRLMEERVYRVFGDSASSRPANVRFLVGTNTDLRAAVREGRFRQDLFYRVNVLPVHLPPLRERRDEIVPWAEHMVGRRHESGGRRGAATLVPEAAQSLLSYHWPGNLRQLDNVIRRAYTMALSELAEEEAPLRVGQSHVRQSLAFEREDATGSLQEVLQQAARAYALEAERRAARGGRLALDLAQCFDALALSAAVTLTGGRKEAYRLYGEEGVVENRNHNKQFKLALGRLLVALSAAGEEPDGALLAQLGDRGRDSKE